jgi:hypothetical protein
VEVREVPVGERAVRRGRGRDDRIRLRDRRAAGGCRYGERRHPADIDVDGGAGVDDDRAGRPANVEYGVIACADAGRDHDVATAVTPGT